ncbi:DUF1489 family protein [soil metagenome]
MPLHMIKLCVGVAQIETLERRSLKAGGLVVNTRMTPKRADEIEDGGSLYWVMKGSVVGRQSILDITTTGEGKARKCLIQLAPEVVRTAPQARRPFQGWRYLEPKDAPMDLTSIDAGELPSELAQQLREMGAW